MNAEMSDPGRLLGYTTCKADVILIMCDIEHAWPKPCWMKYETVGDI